VTDPNLQLAQSYADAAEAHLAQGKPAEALDDCQKGENALADAKLFSGERQLDYALVNEIEATLQRLRETAVRLQPEPADPLTDIAQFESALQRRYANRASWLPLKQSPAGNLEQLSEEPLALTDGFEVTTWVRREELGETTFRKVTLSPAREQWFQEIPAGPNKNDAAILSEEPDTEDEKSVPLIPPFQPPAI